MERSLASRGIALLRGHARFVARDALEVDVARVEAVYAYPTFHADLKLLVG